jgi:CheY-like chemotaxis protein
MNRENFTFDDGPEPTGLRILVVDDNHDAAAMVSALLEFAGHRTSTADNGLDAVREASRVHFDAVVLDLGMPIMNGFEAAAVLRQLRPAPALIACTAWDDPETRQRTTDLGFSAHLRKPVPFELLKATLREVMLGRTCASRS